MLGRRFQYNSISETIYDDDDDDDDDGDRD